MKNLSQVRISHPWGYHVPLDRHADYQYDRFEIAKKKEVDLRQFLQRFGSFYIVDGEGSLRCNAFSRNMSTDHEKNFFCFRMEDKIHISTERGIILQGISLDANPEVFKEGYRVDKSQAWGLGGEELWLQWNSRFCFKRIVLPAGRVTSLQYHENKYETNFIEQGCAHIYRGPQKKSLDATKASLEVVTAGPGDFFPVPIGLVHRIEAITDLILLEASTTHVDDVVRLEDATGRGDGRIVSEHTT